MSKTKKITAAAAAIAALTLLAGCGKKAADAQFASSGSAMASKEMADINGKGFHVYADSAMEYDDAEESILAETPAEAGAAPAPETFERKLIRTGSIDIEVESLADARAALEAWTKRYGGYISDSGEWSNSLSITARIPSANFDAAMSDAAGFGKLRSKNINSQDVTEQYYDIATRLKTKRMMLERLENYLKTAKDMKDLLEIETKINSVTAEVESMQGQLNRLASRVDYATISVQARLPYKQTESGFVLPDARSSFRGFASNILEFFVGLLIVILYVAVCGVPLVLLAILLYWLCFGKIGLLRKLFRKARGK